MHYENEMSRQKFETIEEIDEYIEAFRKFLIIERYEINLRNNIIDKDLAEKRHRIVYGLNPVISTWVSDDLLITIDNLRGKMSRSAFCRMALSEYCTALQEMGSDFSVSKDSRNVEYKIKKNKKSEDTM